MAAPMIDQLERLWLDQLLREFSDICFQRRLDLQPPVFELSGAAQQLGCWLPDRKTIRISRHLIIEHPWDVVLMVLKHEMAHQVCTELFAGGKAGHGPEFQRACTMLGVPEPYNRSSGDLASAVSQPPKDELTDNGRKVIGRINKLLALAGSDNEHEAALAMQRATELLRRHNLDVATIENSADCRRLIINTRSKQIPAYRRAICAILRDYFFVQIICSSLYDPLTDNSYKTIELLGRAENVPVAEHCYHFLEQQLAGLWQKNRHKFQGNTRTAKNSYSLGLLHGFAKKLATREQKNGTNEQAAPATTPTGALTINRDSNLQDFISFHFPRLKKRAARRARIYSRPYDEAVNTGKTIVLHQSVTETKKGVQGLLKG